MKPGSQFLGGRFVPGPALPDRNRSDGGHARQAGDPE